MRVCCVACCLTSPAGDRDGVVVVHFFFFFFFFHFDSGWLHPLSLSPFTPVALEQMIWWQDNRRRRRRGSFSFVFLCDVQLLLLLLLLHFWEATVLVLPHFHLTADSSLYFTCCSFLAIDHHHYLNCAFGAHPHWHHHHQHHHQQQRWWLRWLGRYCRTVSSIF